MSESEAEDDADHGIRALDSKTVQRIAAGEVVERPASVVKELVENSLDADASRISVAVAGDGTRELRIRDDGVGMSESALRTAIEEHTTSKIRDIEDLEAGVGTLGFRGEALHTIGAVSRLTIRSKPRGGSRGTELVYEGGEIQDVSPAGCPEGTVIEVEDLFFNTPARRKFLKTESTEFDHINTVVTQYALANPDVAISLEHDDREVFATEGRGSRESAVLSVYGRAVAESMRSVSGTTEAIDVEGLVSDPETTRSTREYLSTFVNGRYVTSAVLREAVLDAYGGQLAPDRYPFAVLFLDVPAETVDVNVHPRKMEVRFDDEEGVRTAVREAVESALLEHGLIRSAAPRGRSQVEEADVVPEPSAPEGDVVAEPSRRGGRTDGKRAATSQQAVDDVQVTESTGEVDADATESRGEVDADANDAEATEPTTEAVTESNTEANTTDTDADSRADSEASADRPWSQRDETQESTDTTATDLTTDTAARHGGDETGTASTEGGSDRSQRGGVEDGSVTHHARGGEGAAADRAADRDRPERRDWGGVVGPKTQQTLSGGAVDLDREFDRLPRLRVLGQLHETYIVAASEEGLVLVDQHAADERVNYERLRRELEGDTSTQALAEPVELELTAREASLFDEYQDALARVGFHAGRVDERHIEVRTVPTVFDATLDPEGLRDALVGFVGRGEESARETVDAAADELIADLACYPSVTGNTSLTEGSVVDLLDALDSCENPYACPHGRPTVIRVDRDEIEERFERDYPGHAGRRRED